MPPKRRSTRVAAKPTSSTTTGKTASRSKTASSRVTQEEDAAAPSELRGTRRSSRRAAAQVGELSRRALASDDEEGDVDDGDDDDEVMGDAGDSDSDGETYAPPAQDADQDAEEVDVEEGVEEDEVEENDKDRRLRLAKENDLSVSREADVREAFGLFAVRKREFANSREGVIKTSDVRRCLISLDLRPSAADLPEILDALDPTTTGFVPYEPFLAVASLQFQLRASPTSQDSDHPPSPSISPTPPAAFTSKPKSKAKGTGPAAKRKSKGATDEEGLRQAYSLFTKGREGPITVNDLRRVAREIRADEDVSDDMLRAMVLEANGGTGQAGVREGVGWEHFVGVMGRAGIRS